MALCSYASFSVYMSIIYASLDCILDPFTAEGALLFSILGYFAGHSLNDCVLYAGGECTRAVGEKLCP